MANTKRTHREIHRRPVWAEVSASALTHNLRAIRAFVNPPEEKRSSPREVLSVVKGNAYGHGGPQVAKILEKAGSDWFGVTCTSEGIDLRKSGVRRPILVLTSFWPGEEAQLLKHHLTAVVHRCEQLHELERAAPRGARKRRSSTSASLLPSNSCESWASTRESCTLPTAQPLLHDRKLGRTWYALGSSCTATIRATTLPSSEGKRNAACHSSR